MRKLFASLAALLVVASVTISLASERHVKVPFESMNNSGVSGFVILNQLPNEKGSVVEVQVKGLKPGEEYSSFYYESSDCSAPADLFQTFTADKDGHAHLNGKIDDDVDEVGTVSVRLGPSYGTLLACAAMHAQ